MNDGPISRSTDRTKSNPTEGLQKSNLDKLKSIIRKIYWCTLRLGLISTFVNYDFFVCSYYPGFKSFEIWWVRTLILLFFIYYALAMCRVCGTIKFNIWLLRLEFSFNTFEIWWVRTLILQLYFPNSSYFTLNKKSYSTLIELVVKIGLIQTVSD